MSMGNACLAEAYAMRTIHKEKMKKMEVANDDHRLHKEAKSVKEGDLKRKSTASGRTGCFFSVLMFKKIHPKSVEPSSDSS